jgi:LysR family transcriptional regulator, cyn operon transcriptional activator
VAEVRSPDIEGETLLSESLALMVGKSHPYAKRRRAITLEDFNREALVLLNPEFANACADRSPLPAAGSGAAHRD